MKRRFLSSMFATLCTLGLFATAASAQLTSTSLITLPTGGATLAGLNASSVDIYGNLYAATSTGTVYEITANGGPAITIATGLPANGIRGVAADSKGNVFVGVTGSSLIYKYPAGGGAATTIAANRPYGLYVDASDNLYAVDATNHVDKFASGATTPTQTFVFTLPDANGTPRGVVTDSAGNIYVSDLSTTTTTPAVLKMSPAGMQTNLPITGFTSVYGITLDAVGNVYFSDATGGRISKYVPSTGVVTTIVSGLSAATPSISMSPHSELVYVNGKGVLAALEPVAANFYGVPVATTSSVAAFTFSFAAATTFSAPTYTSNNAATAQFKDGGGTTCTSGKTAATTCLLDVVFAPTQTGVATGTVTLSDGSGNLIAKILLSGVGDASLPVFTPGTQSTVLTGLGQLAGVSVDNGSNLYTVDLSHAFVDKTASGTTTALSFTGLSRPTGVAVDGAGAVYVSDASNNAVYKLTAAGVQTTVTTTGLSAPKGIALDALGDVFIADSGNARVVKIDASGNQAVVGLTGLVTPAFVAVDYAGNVFVTDSGKVYEYTVTGAQKTLTTAGLTAPAGIAVGADGSLYVADASNGDVYVLLPASTSFTLASGLGTASGIALGANGSLYAASGTTGNVVLVDRTKQTLTFPGTATGATSAAMTAAVQNAGNGVLQNSALTVSSGFAQVTPGGGDCTATSVIAVGATCNVNITFSPTAVGAASGTVTFTDNALNVVGTTQTISLVATGIHDFTTTLAQTTPATGNPVYGSAVTVTATVVANVPGAPTPTGTVTFTVDGGQNMVVGLSSAKAAYSPTGLAVGTHTVVATYSGDADPAQFVITVSPAVVTVTTAPQTRQYGQANAAFTPMYAGFVSPDTSAAVTGTPSFTTTATTTTDPGVVTITTDVSALKAANYTFVAQNSSITITKATNTIDFTTLPTSVVYGALPIALTATATLPNGAVTFTVSGTTGATISANNSVVIGNTGSVTVTANQAGNTDYAAATPVSQTFTVTPATLTLTADNKSKVQGAVNPAFTFTASGFVYSDNLANATSNAPSLTTVATQASGSGTYAIIIAAGSPAFMAKNYNVVYVPGTLTITGNTAQTITFPALSNLVYGAAAPTLSASTNAAGLSVNYTIAGSGATLSNGVLTITGVGTVTVTAHQPGNATYAAAADVSQSFTITPAVLTVTAQPATRAYGAADPAFGAKVTGFVYSDTPASVYGAGAASVTDPGVTITTDPGMYNLVPTQGNLVAANYTFAFVNGTLTITKASQTITFTPTLGNVTYGQGPITLTATTTAANQSVTYTTTGGVSVSGSTLTITGAGAASVTAHQAGNTDYATATDVTQSFTVAPAALTVTANDASVAFGQPLPAFTAAYAGFKYSDTTSVISGSPTYTVSGTAPRDAGQYSITPAVGTLTAANYTFGPFVAGTLTVGQAAQTITFPALANVPQTAAAGTTGTVTLSATATSQLAVVYTVTGPAGVTVTQPAGTTPGFVTYGNTPGVVTVTATQPGNTDYSAATPVVQTFTILGSTTTAVTLSSPTANTGASVTLTATVSGKITGVQPTGTVVFFAGTTALNATTPAPASCAVQSGTTTCKATLATTVIPPGTIAITAVYSGDGTFTGSTSPAVSILIIAADYNVTSTSTNLTMKAGDSASSTITITPLGAYADTLNFACSNLPANMYCTFAPPALNFYPGTGTTTAPQTTTVTITAKAQATASLHLPGLRGEHSGVELAALFFGLPMAALMLRRRKKMLRIALMLLLAVVVSVGVTGCGSNITNLATVGTYNVHVDMTDGTSVTHTLTITVTVQ